jgi:vancomycin aglycone glucosyltransferase
MRVLVAAMGSRGDVQPMLALAVALRARGHDVLVSAPPDFAAWAGELGLPFLASGRNVQEVLTEHAAAMGANPLRILEAIRKIIAAEVPGSFESTLAAARGCGAIVYAGQFAGSSVGEKLGIPCASVVYSPTMLRSSHHPPFVAHQQGMPRWMNALAWGASEVIINRMLRGAINVARAKLDLAPVKSVQRHVFEGWPALLACDPVVAPAPPDWDSLDVTTTGPWFYDDPSPLDAEVEAFLDAGPPPVYVGFGSMVTDEAARITRALLEGAGGRRLLLSKGWAGIGGGNLPDTVKVVHGPMPHAKLFPRVAAVVHHGGSGTTAAALRAGAPQVLVPHIMDQFYYAYRLRSLGIAPAGIPVRKLTAARLRAALEEALALPPGPRLEAAARLREGGGIARAVERIEALRSGA